MRGQVAYTSFGASCADENSQGGASQGVNLEGLLLVRDHTAQHLSGFFLAPAHDFSKGDVQFSMEARAPLLFSFLSEFGRLCCLSIAS